MCNKLINKYNANAGEREREREREREKGKRGERVYVVFVFGWQFYVASGTSRHNRKRGCIPLVDVPIF